MGEGGGFWLSGALGAGAAGGLVEASGCVAGLGATCGSDRVGSGGGEEDALAVESGRPTPCNNLRRHAPKAPRPSRAVAISNQAPRRERCFAARAVWPQLELVS